MPIDQKLEEKALDALVEIHPGNMTPMAEKSWNKAIEALRARLAQPEQDGECSYCDGAGCIACDARFLSAEPVAWMIYTLDGESVCVTANPTDFTPEHKALPLFTAPPQREWQGLTDEEIDATVEACKTTNTYKYFRAIEQKLKEKNHG